jgi:hypothetical protein
MGERDFIALIDGVHQLVRAPVVLVWDRLNTLSRAMGELITEREWLTVFLLPAYSPDLNPVEWVWAHIKRSLANLAVVAHDRLEALAVLGTPVGVENDAVDPATAGSHSHLDRVSDQRGAHVVCDRPAHHPPRADVDHRGEVEPRRAGYIGDVAAPSGVQPVGGEVTHHQVRNGRRGPVRDRRPLLLPQVPAGFARNLRRDFDAVRNGLSCRTVPAPSRATSTG